MVKMEEEENPGRMESEDERFEEDVLYRMVEMYEKRVN